ncbi:MAG TPA: hypothetical protein VMT29_00250 [Steroidobacteraceae bacterium]|nr:hypothetical protein [Steroidobacteraceae bacterium]
MGNETGAGRVITLPSRDGRYSGPFCPHALSEAAIASAANDRRTLLVGTVCRERVIRRRERFME